MNGSKHHIGPELRYIAPQCKSEINLILICQLNIEFINLIFNCSGGRQLNPISGVK